MLVDLIKGKAVQEVNFFFPGIFEVPFEERSELKMRRAEMSDPPRTPLEKSSFAFVLTNLPYVLTKTKKQKKKM